MGRLAWLFLLIGILQGWAQAQSRAGGTVIGDTHTEIASSLTVPPIPQPRTPTPAASVGPLQQFQCNGKVTLEACRQEMLVLKTLLDKYGADRLGRWKWVLVSSQEWEMLLAKKGLSPNVPAFSALEARTTLFDDALLSGSPGRLSQLMDAWHLGRSGLLGLAVRHELSHALCKDDNEVRAIRNADFIEHKRPPLCSFPSSSSKN